MLTFEILALSHPYDAPRMGPGYRPDPGLGRILTTIQSEENQPDQLNANTR